MKGFASIDLGGKGVPDATPLLNFRHLFEAHELTKRIIEKVNAHLAECVLLMRKGAHRSRRRLRVGA